MTIDSRISKRLKERRKERGMSIQQLSKKSSVSTGQISQIEQGKVIPTVVCLYKLAKALTVDLNYFFEDDMKVIKQEAGTRRIVITNEGNNSYELLSPSGNMPHTIDFTKITLEPNSRYEDPDCDITHDGEEAGYILSGSMSVFIDGIEHVLHEGDSIYFSSTKPHHYENPFDEECISIWAMTPRFF